MQGECLGPRPHLAHPLYLANAHSIGPVLSTLQISTPRSSQQPEAALTPEFLVFPLSTPSTRVPLFTPEFHRQG